MRQEHLLGLPARVVAEGHRALLQPDPVAQDRAASGRQRQVLGGGVGELAGDLARLEELGVAERGRPRPPASRGRSRSRWSGGWRTGCGWTPRCPAPAREPLPTAPRWATSCWGAAAPEGDGGSPAG